jgi:hypothetical protein
MTQWDLNVISTLTSKYTYTHTSQENLSSSVGTHCHPCYSNMPPISLQFGIKILYFYRLQLLTFHHRTYTCAALYFHLPLSQRFNTQLQSIAIILLLQLIFKDFCKSRNVTKSWNLHIFPVYYIIPHNSALMQYDISSLICL